MISAAVALLLGVSSTGAMAAEPCATPEETAAFQVRHLQSRFMVAALSCNQADAYNGFVTRFQPVLAEMGRKLVAYYSRAGGTPALNRAVTVLANTASQLRGADPQGFCTATWNLFWELGQTPDQLAPAAARHVMTAAPLPQTCGP